VEEGWPIRVHFVGVGYYTTCAFVSAFYYYYYFSGRGGGEGKGEERGWVFLTSKCKFILSVCDSYSLVHGCVVLTSFWVFFFGRSHIE